MGYMFGYTKLFESIVTSTIWQEDLATKVVWVTMLALKNRNHVVEASVPGLAHVAGVSLAECEAALKRFESPDPYSRSREFDGRRIERCDGGWVILNGEKFQKLLSLEDRREYKRVKQAEYRARGKPLPGEVEAVKAYERGDSKSFDSINEQTTKPGVVITRASSRVSAMDQESY
jgi:hypothetical protein